MLWVTASPYLTGGVVEAPPPQVFFPPLLNDLDFNNLKWLRFGTLPSFSSGPVSEFLPRGQNPIFQGKLHNKNVPYMDEFYRL